MCSRRNWPKRPFAILGRRGGQRPKDTPRERPGSGGRLRVGYGLGGRCGRRRVRSGRTLGIPGAAARLQFGLDLAELGGTASKGSRPATSTRKSTRNVVRERGPRREYQPDGLKPLGANPPRGLQIVQVPSKGGLGLVPAQLVS